MWQQLQAWVAKKGGVVHLIALEWAFLVFAYKVSPDFHHLIQHAYSTLPAWAVEAVEGLIPLIALYKTWEGGTGNQAVQQPAVALPDPSVAQSLHIAPPSE